MDQTIALGKLRKRQAEILRAAVVKPGELVSNRDEIIYEIIPALVKKKRAEDDSRELRAIEAALVRIEKGTYGLCCRCGEFIPDARLEPRPEAVQCIDCEGNLVSVVTEKPKRPPYAGFSQPYFVR